MTQIVRGPVCVCACVCVCMHERQYKRKGAKEEKERQLENKEDEKGGTPKNCCGQCHGQAGPPWWPRSAKTKEPMGTQPCGLGWHRRKGHKTPGRNLAASESVGTGEGEQVSVHDQPRDQCMTRHVISVCPAK